MGELDSRAPLSVEGGTPASKPGFIRAIGRWDLTAAVVNAVIGSAIFSMPSTQAALTGTLSPLAYAFAGLGILMIVLCFAEVASRFRDPGGPHLYCREAFGPFVGFQAGWLTFWVRVTAVAANLNVFVDYLAQVLPAVAVPAGRLTTMALVLSLVTALNIVGVRQATWAIDLFTIGKLVPLGLLIVLGVTRIDSEILATQAVAHPQWTEAILLLVYAYGGFEAPLIPAGEARDPRKDTAFALLTALLAIGIIYMLVQLVVVGVVPHAAGEKAPVAAAFRVLMGPAGVALASIGAMVSIYGWATGSVLQSPRVVFSMAERGELPHILARLHPRFRTPDLAILLYSALAFTLAVYGSFAWNATLSAIVRLVTYGGTCVALLVFRRRRSSDGPTFRVPFGWVIAPAGALFCLELLRRRTFTQAWILLGIMGLGWILWRVAGRGSGQVPEAAED